jgi:quinol monooxygenase YgiN
MALTIVAHVHAAAGKQEALFTALRALVPPTLAEAGCVKYDLHRDDSDPAHFMFYETWETRDHWLDHMKAPHLVAHQAATKEMVASAAIYELTRV